MAARRSPTGTAVRRRRRDRRVLRILLALLGVAVATIAAFLWPYWRLSGRLEAGERPLPSRLYAVAPRLELGARASVEQIVLRLEATGHRRASGGELAPGTFQTAPGQVAVFQRRFLGPAGATGGAPLTIDLDEGRVARLLVGRAPVEVAYLEPRLLASYYGSELLDIREVAAEELPREVVRAILAAEDARFFEHPGLSASGIARALWVNLRGGELRQGGSTLTQQLVKNRFLTHERTMKRKAREALLALFVELRYDKREILEAYLNEVFWGKPGSVNLIGLGAAARAYFDKEPAELSLAEAALLAGMLRSPAELSPLRQPEAALARRNQVLARLAELEWASRDEVERAKASPLGVVETRYGRNRAPFWGAYAAAEARRRWGVEELADRGLVLLSTLDPGDQEAAERAVAETLTELEKEAKSARGRGLEAAFVALSPSSGAITAYVGGRDFRVSQFDRVVQARRQAGSAFKPVVYAAAFASGVANPATPLDDSPLTVTLANQTWSPANDDDRFRGWVPARQALEASLNVPTAKLALAVGLPPIVDLAKRMGVSAPLQPLPALSLGAFALSPLDLATVYATLANQGVRPPVHGLAALFDRAGEVVAGAALPPPERVLDPASAYLVTSLLEGVVERGTARRARDLGLEDRLAGKTGTSNLARDSWFAGYSSDRAALAWVGRDDDAATPYSGARAALPIWVRFMKAVRPPQGFAPLAAPAGIVEALVDPESGGLATDACPRREPELFREGALPAPCSFHRGPWSVLAREPQGPGPPREREGRAFLRWLRRIFGADEKPPATPTPQPPRR